MPVNRNALIRYKTIDTCLRNKYRSFKARLANAFVFYPYLLKEYRNRWFVFGAKEGARVYVIWC